MACLYKEWIIEVFVLSSLYPPHLLFLHFFARHWTGMNLTCGEPLNSGLDAESFQEVVAF